MLSLKHLEEYSKAVEVLKKWVIAQEKNILNNITKPKHYYYVGNDNVDLSPKERLLAAGFKEDEINGLRFISYYTAKDIAEILGNEMEDRNKHSLTSLWSNMLDSLNKTAPQLSEKAKCLIMCNIFEKTF